MAAGKFKEMRIGFLRKERMFTIDFNIKINVVSTIQ